MSTDSYLGFPCPSLPGKPNSGRTDATPPPADEPPQPGAPTFRLGATRAPSSPAASLQAGSHANGEPAEPSCALTFCGRPRRPGSCYCPGHHERWLDLVREVENDNEEL